MVRRRLRVEGLVQGVGFRPFVHRSASRLGLVGFVANQAAGVVVEVEGERDAVAAFEAALLTDVPPLARVDAVHAEVQAPRRDTEFRIAPSAPGGPGVTVVPPDVATCDACLAELLDPADRRHRYPFVNCTDCGPRFTIIEALPYDRPATTMRAFPMCADCAREYHDPGDRRFHAQPVACPACGPTLRLTEADGAVRASGERALAEAQEALVTGRIVAVKGLGGYHLVCDATNGRAVAELRRRKARGAKPFAVLVADLDAARAVADVDGTEAQALLSPARPIVLVRRHAGPAAERIAADVAPGNPLLGVLLPYTPLHHLLVRAAPGGTDSPSILVCTSANRADEPIAFEDDDARRRLAGLADLLLVHDRPIHVPCDDSVSRVVAGAVQPIRRARGFAPLPVALPTEVRPVLAVGADLKTAFCVAHGRQAWLSQHLGDMGTVETLQAFERTIAQFARTYGVEPEVVACDAHPGYVTSGWARRAAAALGVPWRAVQHHRAHVAALLAEHGLAPTHPLIGVAFDGTGHGDDGTVWGGEFLVTGPEAAGAPLQRAARLAAVPLPGGDAAVVRPARVALAHLGAAGIGWDAGLPPVAACAPEERRVLARLLESGRSAVPTSSMGRLFDAVASLAGVRHEVHFEAEAAIELEGLVPAGADPDFDDAYRFGRRWDVDGCLVLDPAPVVRAVVADVRGGVEQATLARRFHAAVAAAVVDTADRLRERWGTDTVGLTGGCFQNATLTQWTAAGLRSEGFHVLVHREVPANDGGVALGQAVLAAA